MASKTLQLKSKRKYRDLDSDSNSSALSYSKNPVQNDNEKFTKKNKINRNENSNIILEENDRDSAEEDILYEVEEIIGKKYIKGKVHYLVKWDGYPSEQNTWEPIENLSNVEDLIELFELQERKNRKFPKRKTVEHEKKNLNNNYPSTINEIIEDYKNYGIEDFVAYNKKQRIKKKENCQNSVNRSNEIEKTRETKITNNVTNVTPSNSIQETGISCISINENNLNFSDNLGDISKDIPEAIKYAKICDNKIYFMVEWKERKNATKPEESLVPHEFIKKKYPYVLIDFYESRLRCVKSSNKQKN